MGHKMDKRRHEVKDRDCWQENLKGRGKLERHTEVRVGEPTRQIIFFITILLNLYT